VAASTALSAHPVVRGQDVLGEGPLWVRSTGRLLWSDIMGRRLHALEPDTGRVESHGFPFYVACMGETDAACLVAASALGWLEFRRGFEDPTVLSPPPFDGAAVRFNDGKIGPDRAFWAGCMDLNGREPIAALYRLSSAGADEASTGPENPAAHRVRVQELEQALTISNGIGWSPDKKTMYLTDSGPAVIWKYDFDQGTGSIGNRRIFLRDADRPGAPDGLAVDAEGNVWSARWGAGAVICYDAQGKQRAQIQLPALHTTSCCFGGDDLDVLYITSARYGLENPGELDGALFACPCGARGQEPCLFATNDQQGCGGSR
jgi:sugar lactone lactonase YvrE